MTDVVRNVLTAFRLDRAEPSELVGGMTNSAWKVQDGALSYVLRRHDRREATASQVRSELLWLEVLGSESNVRTPVPVRLANGSLAPVAEPGPDGDALAFWTLVSWVDGDTLERLPDAREAGLIGSMLADMHGRARAWRPPPEFDRLTYDAWLFETSARTLVTHAGEQLTARARLDLHTALGLSTVLLERLRRDPEQTGLIHADIHDGNVVFGGEPRQAGVIDFARFGFGPWALDLAMAMHYLTEDLSVPLFEAHHSRFILSPDAERALPNLRFLAAVENLAILSGFPDEAEFVASELPGLVAQAERLLD